ncbi:MAG TPA: 5'/3'-nucleotidase SurE [Alphaproteobacteria bacterium]|jgi:5'-nucleotidase|nr:5'/3'-nucleotidase SurE [Alphaproteobacteria bacterium]MDP6269722.1 5'/3'-nucleotidase SurE [Alphaproteobacteria bacterium]MDP7164415.1 5'/3'-nucleotidase SurE [Alphaproteobacteria bacterium]MDP7428449.1 5'/3'-nucleotidase SurE [Alphaproteobacteria bacterium]HJM51584.1 5'/3'-nucleotidase SurE [Alphaproteobacteria bacterium]
MAKVGKKLSKSGASDLRILIANDDGIRAPGLKVMERIARTLSKDIWVVAPETEQSGAGHSLTLHEPLRIRRLSSRRYAVRGTPTDCVLMALSHILKDQKRPDLLLSGVNRGANMGEDVTYSGTVAAAMEGTLVGIPSIALSQAVVPGQTAKWATTESHAPALIRRLLAAGWPDDTLININFPDVVAAKAGDLQITVQGRRDTADLVIDARVDARGQPYFWIGYRRNLGTPYPAATDLGVVEAGGISLTPLQIDLTHRATVKALKKSLT